MLSAKEQSLLDALAKRADECGVEIVTVEVSGGKKAPRICVYIDTPDGVDFDTLQSSTQWIGELMDEIDPYPGAYQLEVSSPGIDRPLRTPGHFMARIGETAVVRVKERIDGRGTFTGTIAAADDEKVVLCVEGADFSIPYAAMKRANLKGIVDFKRSQTEA